MLGGLIIVVGLGSILTGFVLATLSSSIAAHKVRIADTALRIEVLEEAISGVDVYELRIATIEKQVTANTAAAAIAAIALNDLKGDVRILYDREVKPVVAKPPVPADDVREQYYLYGQGRR